jgi:hypothetical protein
MTKEQNYSTSIISLENSESSLPALKSQSNSESDSPNEIIKGKTFSNERFHINFAQSSEISSSQYISTKILANFRSTFQNRLKP